jgi:glutamate-1-semialdehyde aminotransferase
MVNNRYRESEIMLERALKTIPLGSQTFSKSYTHFPFGVSPFFVTHGDGSYIWDVDRNKYVDFINGLASVSVGYNFHKVNDAVIEQIYKGVTFSLPTSIEADVAELLVELIPCAEKVRFAKNGTDVTSAAIRLSRAYTGKEHILVCGYHGWQDWYIGSTTRDLGVPESVKNLTHAFAYNDISSLNQYFEKYHNKVAAVIMEPISGVWPISGYLAEVKNITHKNNAVLIFDETVTGCRVSKGGAQELFNVTPDLATVGKGIANGFPLSAIVGKAKIMDMMEDIFFSGTFGGETVSLSAAKVVLNMVKKDGLVEHLNAIGEKIISGVRLIIDKTNLGNVVKIEGHPTFSYIDFLDTDGYSSSQIKTFFLQEVFRRGILTLGGHNISYSHSDTDVIKLLNVYDEVLQMISDSIENRTLQNLLLAEPPKPLFKVR